MEYLEDNLDEWLSDELEVRFAWSLSGHVGVSFRKSLSRKAMLYHGDV